MPDAGMCPVFFMPENQTERADGRLSRLIWLEVPIEKSRKCPGRDTGGRFTGRCCPLQTSMAGSCPTVWWFSGTKSGPFPRLNPCKCCSPQADPAVSAWCPSSSLLPGCRRTMGKRAARSSLTTVRISYSEGLHQTQRARRYCLRLWEIKRYCLVPSAGERMIPARAWRWKSGMNRYFSLDMNKN